MKRAPALDGVRAIAILCVLACHAFCGPGWLGLWSASGSFGVMVFMTLSGYLITSVMLVDESNAGQLQLGRFYRRRAWRILPALYAYLIAIAVLGAAAVIPAPSLESWLAGALYVRNLIGGDQRITEHLWSLSLEEQFYFTWPVLFILTRRFRVPFIVSSIAATAALRFIWLRGGAPWIALSNEFNPGHVISFHPLLRMDTFLIGAIFAVCPPKWVVDTPILPLGLLAGIWYFFANESALHTSVAAFFIAAVISALVQNPASFETRFLSSPCLVAIGALSYSIYLWQQLFLVQDIRAFRWWSVPAVAAVSTASYWLIERPALKMKDRNEREQLSGRVIANTVDPTAAVARF